MCPAATLTSPEMEMGTILNILGILIGISRKMEYLPLKRRTDGKIHIRVFGPVIPEHVRGGRGGGVASEAHFLVCRQDVVCVSLVEGCKCISQV